MGYSKRARSTQSHSRLFSIFEETEVLDRAPKVNLLALPQKQLPVLSEAQVQSLLDCLHMAAPGPQSTHDRTLIALMLDTGIRRSTASGITIGQPGIYGSVCQDPRNGQQVSAAIDRDGGCVITGCPRNDRLVMSGIHKAFFAHQGLRL